MVSGRRPPVGAAFAVAAFVLAVTAAARADGASEAQRLFDEAHALLDAGRVADACERFRQSLDLDRAPGTLLNLGVCLARAGALVEARATLLEARARAEADARPERAQLAERYLADIDRRIARLTVRTRGPERDRGHVELDGQPIAPEAAAAGLPIDPGRHNLRVDDARGRLLQASMYVAEASAAAVEVSLERPPIAPAPPPAGPSRAPAASPWAAVGWLGIGLGVASTGVSLGLAAEAAALDGTADRDCDETRCASPQAASAAGQASDFATGANVALAAGATLVVAGVLTLIFAPHEARRPEEGSPGASAPAER